MPPLCSHEHHLRFVDHEMTKEHVPKWSTENYATETKLITQKHAKYLPLSRIFH